MMDIVNFGMQIRSNYLISTQIEPLSFQDLPPPSLSIGAYMRRSISLFPASATLMYWPA